MFNFFRSSAVVTYSKSKFPNFLKLSPQTNLNLAPSNWLRSGYGNHFNFQFPNLHNTCFKDQLFPSFSIAENHLNDLDGIDVISDAEVCFFYISFIFFDLFTVSRTSRNF